MLYRQQFFSMEFGLSFCLTLVFHRVLLVFLPNTITLYEWPYISNSLTAFVWRAIIGWNMIQYSKIGFEYVACNIPISKLKSFKYSKHAGLFVPCKFFIVILWLVILCLEIWETYDSVITAKLKSETHENLRDIWVMFQLQNSNLRDIWGPVAEDQNSANVCPCTCINRWLIMEYKLPYTTDLLHAWSSCMQWDVWVWTVGHWVVLVQVGTEVLKCYCSKGRWVFFLKNQRHPWEDIPCYSHSHKPDLPVTHSSPFSTWVSILEFFILPC